ncbi:MAG: hypothetical protein R2780_01795 [Crocinitomicaceae bacterium]
MEQKKETKKNKTGMYVLLGLAVVGITGTAIYFATRPKNSPEILDSENTDFSPEPVRSSGGSSGSSSGFPLKKGSRGELVKNLQEALIQKYGADILPKYGADGGWGTETQNALLAKGLPTVITAEDFTKIVTGSGSDGSGSSTPTTTKKKFNPSLLASNLHAAILDDDFNRASNSLSKIFTTTGYTKVNNYFKEKRIYGIRKTLVNALLTQFNSSSEKKKLNEHFYRMGMKYNGDQWSLSGIGQFCCDQIKSMQKTEVWNKEGKRIAVPKDTILGEFLDARHGVAKFKTLDDKILYTHTNTIGYV